MSFIRKETAKGIISKKNKNLLYITTSSGPSCSSAEKQKCDSGCGACSGVNAPTRSLTIYSPQANNYTVGNEITFKYFSINDAIIAIVAFGLPIGCALISLICWSIYMPEKVESLPSLLSAGAAFAFGLFLLWILDAIFKRKLPAEILTPPQKL